VARYKTRIRLKARWEIDRLYAANQIVCNTLSELKEKLQDGITTKDIDLLAEERIVASSAKPAFKGYRGFPATTCVSINNEIVHGIPSEKRVLKRGDLVSIDLGVVYHDYYGDAAFSALVDDEGTDVARDLLRVTEESLYAGIKRMKLRKRLGDVSSAIQNVVEMNGFGVVRQFVGHGIGRALHEPPEVPNYGRKGTGPVLRTGMVIAIEPMVTEKSPEAMVLEDGWTAVTVDGGLAAHFEHTVAITEKGPKILSKC
jgi:methionyl aminopeptidase